MNYKDAFLSLRWKLTALFGSVFLMLHSVFSYLSYLDAIDKFDKDRKTIVESHINLANALTEDSFSVLEQFIELLSLLVDFSAKNKLSTQTLSVLDEQYSRWQLSWGIENIAFFDQNAAVVKSWGNQVIAFDDAVSQVLKSEQPEHRVICNEHCFLQVLVPVIEQTRIKGVFSVISSMDNVIIKYKHATNADIGLLVIDKTYERAKTNPWDLKLAAMTTPEKNHRLFDYISRQYSIDQLTADSKTVKLADAVFEVCIVSYKKPNSIAPPKFLFVDDVTSEYANLNSDLKKVWMYGVLSLLGSLALLIAVLHLSLRRVVKLAQAIPLLSEHRYDQFREQLSVTENRLFGTDEIDQLTSSALTLTTQLENLELKVRRNTFKLLEKSQDLVKERDFIQQLVELAPIIIITQKLNGIILSINKAGIDAFAMENHAIVGQVFDGFLPEQDHEHLTKLNQLRKGNQVHRVQVDSFLITAAEQAAYISWLHTILKSYPNGDEDTVILTLGMDISARKIAEQSMLKMTGYDYLTGLMNRSKFHEKCTFELAMAKRYSYQTALFYLNLDHFKEVNDQGGIEVGDQLLIKVANRLQKVLRTTDLLSRIGGDEFAVIMPHIDITAIHSIAKKLQHLFKNLNFQISGQLYKVSASIGISIFPIQGDNCDELLANADMAMYESKAAGCAQYHIFSSDCDYQLKLGRMLQWRELLENALAQQRLLLLYQPILEIATNTISHYECLVRLQQADGELIAAGDFIKYAEELGLIAQIDRWVLKQAVQQLLSFKKQGKCYGLTINMSVLSLQDAAMMTDMADILKSADIEPSKIMVEMTESAAVVDFACSEAVIEQIKTLGCSVALDDFGVGFSSFYYLKQFPVDVVKIDGSFIKQLERGEDDRIFVKSLSGVAQAFGKKTIAEFVENEAILTILKELGIDYAQGYFIGKPEPLQ
ncbi:MAG: EAL domain-containing protein [Methylococcales bacterium]